MVDGERFSLLGYSERGMLWTLFGELSRRAEGLQQLEAIVGEMLGTRTDALVSATVLIEQSLSDFGDADVVLLLDYLARRQALFIEAKVKCHQTWSVAAEFERYRRASDAGKADFSNLFVQLYAKQRLVEALNGHENISDVKAITVDDVKTILSYYDMPPKPISVTPSTTR